MVSGEGGCAVASVVLMVGPMLASIGRPRYTGRMPDTPADLLIILAAYLIGSISFAVIVSRGFGLPDPRTYGSKNPGATNVLRSGRKAAAILTLGGDGLKGWLARIGLGRLPGDFTFRIGGREWFVPLASSLLLSLVAMAIGALV